jgi:cell division protein ZapE
MRSSSVVMTRSVRASWQHRGVPPSLTDRCPDPPVASLVAGLAPPPRFDAVRFATYQPAHPSQAEARDRLLALASALAAPAPRPALLARLRGRSLAEPVRSAYLDGGFGVGKTHLLASLWHAVTAAGGRATYASFRELVSLVGALSLPRAVPALRGVRLVCVDEFELDDPANTRLVATLLGALVDGGATVVTTSNTLPGQLGRGRFDAERFRREIETLAATFDVLRIDGEDYRHRGAMEPPRAWTPAEVSAAATAAGPGATLDRLGDVLAHLATLHPVRYRALVDGLPGVFLLDAAPVDDLNAALRLAYLVDVLYDAGVPVGLAGCEIPDLFPAPFRRGAYAKLLGRAVSRLGALLREAEESRRPAAHARRV